MNMKMKMKMKMNMNMNMNVYKMISHGQHLNSVKYKHFLHKMLE